MNYRPTPETTSARRVNHLNGNLPRYVVDVEVSERLERQRDEAVEMLRRYGLGYSDSDLKILAESESRMGEIGPDDAKREIKRRATIASVKGATQ